MSFEKSHGDMQCCKTILEFQCKSTLQKRCHQDLPADHRFKEVGQYHCIKVLKSYKLCFINDI